MGFFDLVVKILDKKEHHSADPEQGPTCPHCGQLLEYVSGTVRCPTCGDLTNPNITGQLLLHAVRKHFPFAPLIGGATIALGWVLLFPIFGSPAHDDEPLGSFVTMWIVFTLIFMVLRGRFWAFGGNDGQFGDGEADGGGDGGGDGD